MLRRKLWRKPNVPVPASRRPSWRPNVPPITWGAQDVRTLFSIDRGRTLRPFEQAIDSAVDPLQAYVAVRHVGYWVEGFVSLAAAEHPVLLKAAEALKTVYTAATAGAKCSDLTRLTAEKIRPYDLHGMTAGNIG